MGNPYNPDFLYRRSIRLSGYDYSQAGAYFVTNCTEGRMCLFGEIADGQVRLNEYGQIVVREWIRSAEMRPGIALDEWVIMPNHIHGIIIIKASGQDQRNRQVGDQQVAPTGPKSRSVGAVLAGFKAASTKQINQLRGSPGVPVWQRNYYEHIIRNEEDMNRIRAYIIENPMRWDQDTENPARIINSL